MGLSLKTIVQLPRWQECVEKRKSIADGLPAALRNLSTQMKDRSTNNAIATVAVLQITPLQLSQCCNQLNSNCRNDATIAIATRSVADNEIASAAVAHWNCCQLSSGLDAIWWVTHVRIRQKRESYLPYQSWKGRGYLPFPLASRLKSKTLTQRHNKSIFKDRNGSFFTIQLWHLPL